MTTTIKVCPFCMGDIPVEAKKCRHCGEWINKYRFFKKYKIILLSIIGCFVILIVLYYIKNSNFTNKTPSIATNDQSLTSQSDLKFDPSGPEAIVVEYLKSNNAGDRLKCAYCPKSEQKLIERYKDLSEPSKIKHIFNKEIKNYTNRGERTVVRIKFDDDSIQEYIMVLVNAKWLIDYNATYGVNEYSYVEFKSTVDKLINFRVHAQMKSWNSEKHLLVMKIKTENDDFPYDYHVIFPYLFIDADESNKLHNILKDGSWHKLSLEMVNFGPYVKDGTLTPSSSAVSDKFKEGW